jgi:hypothetical protein
MITLADIATLRPDAESLRDRALVTLKSHLRRVPGGIDAFAEYEGAIRELEVLHRLELELIANGNTSTPLPVRAAIASERPHGVDASSRAVVEIAAPEAREKPASNDSADIASQASTSAPLPSVGEVW